MGRSVGVRCSLCIGGVGCESGSEGSRRVERLSVAELCVELLEERIPWAVGNQGRFPLYLVYT